MKYIVIVGDGMADWPLEELGGKTPLQKAYTPHMERLAVTSILGKVRTVPEEMHPGSDVANLSILGYDPVQYYSGRAPLEAASIGVELGKNDVAFRCNLVTLKYNRDKTSGVMEDYSTGHISSDEAAELIRQCIAMKMDLGGNNIQYAHALALDCSWEDITIACIINFLWISPSIQLPKKTNSILRTDYVRQQ